MKIILSIDGGGIRSIIPTAILAYLEKRIQETQKNKNLRIANLIDFVTGTSTSSILGAIMLIPDKKKISAPKYSMEEILQMYFNEGEFIYKENFFHSLKTLWGLIGPKYSETNINSFLLQQLNHYKLENLIKPCMFTGYDIKNKKVRLYTNCDDDKKSINYYVKDIIRGSIAFPSYFSPASVRNGMNIETIIDGGIFAENPCMCGYIEASKILFKNNKKIFPSPRHLIIISLGTGKLQKKLYSFKKSKKWGRIQWFSPILDIIRTSSSEVINYQLEKLFKSYNKTNNYIRINPLIINGSPSLNDGSKKNLLNLLKDANNYIENNKEKLDSLVKLICDINYIVYLNNSN